MRRSGWSEKEVLKIRSSTGENILPQKGEISPFSIFFGQFKSPLIYILILVAMLSLAFREYSNAIIIAVVITLNSLMGFFQEYHAQCALVGIKRILNRRNF